MINLIGISGKIGSGKDLVGSIIQYLYWKKLVLDKGLVEDNQLVEFSEFNNLYLDDNNFKIKKFSTKLKQIVALLIGCTVEDLESQEFKSSPLGKEWERWYWSHYKMTNSHNTKGKVSGYFVLEEEALEYKKNLDKDYVSIARELKSEILTPRIILQELGTQGLRDLIHPNSHINGLFADYIGQCNSQFCLGTKQCPDEHITKDCNAVYPNWIVTDCRFPNEVQAIKERNGIVIRINRNNIDASSTHESETALDNAEFDYILNNNSDIPHLIEEVRKMLVHFKIL